MTIHELRAKHIQDHWDHKCECSLWYVPTPVHLRLNDGHRKAIRRQRERSVK